VLSTTTVQTLDDDELQAVLQHEASHVRRRDPATYAIVRGSVNALLFLPAVRGSAERTILDAEIDADAAAIQRVGRGPLLRALARLDAADTGLQQAAVGSIDGMMSDRIRVLSGRALAPAVSARDLRRSAAGVAIVLLPLVGLIAALSRTQ
jgi:Zn-dependent protease with chaperone function